MNLATNKTVREVALENPGATRVFENLGIDYCCGGNRPLADACAAVGITPDEVEKRLGIANAPHAQFEETNFRTATLAELIDHIVEKHHVFTKTEIARLRALLDKVHGVHGQNHPEIAQTLYQALDEFDKDLHQHIHLENNVLFPRAVEMERVAEAAPVR